MPLTVVDVGLLSWAHRYVTERQQLGEILPKSARTLRGILVGFAVYAGVDKPPSRVTRRQVERWLLGHTDDWSAGTRRNYLSAVRTWYRWMEARGVVRSDPTVGIGKIKQPKLVPRGVRQLAVAAALGSCPDARARLILILMVQEGLRCMEVAGLQLGDIDFDGRVMLVRGKGQKERVLPVSDETWHALTAYLAERPARAGPLVRSYVRPTTPLTPTYVSNLVATIMHRAGVEETAHALRHTCATDMLRAGAHLRDVQYALGHQSLSTTQRYLPWLVGDLRKAMSGRRYGATPGPATEGPTEAHGA